MREGRGPQAGQGTKTAAMTLGRGPSPEAVRRGGGGLLPAGLLLPVLLMLAGCDGPQSALDVAGRAARAVAALFWVMLAGAAVLWTLVLGTATYSSPIRRGPPDERAAPLFPVGAGLPVSGE